MNQEFNDFPWHDAELKEIIIDRKENDIIKILINWPEDFEFSTTYIEFFSCYAFHSNMNFGIIPPDTILEAACIIQSEEINKIRNTWFKMGLNLPQLYCYKIITNSTNSVINIFALGFRIIPIP